MLRTAVAAIVGLSSIAVAHATPTTFQHSGRLLDAQGSPINGDVTLTVDLAATSGGTAFWSQTFTDVPVEGGYFAVEVGGGATPLTADDLDRAEVWLTTTFPGSTTEPQRLLAVPYAVRAAEANTVIGDGSVVQMQGVQTRAQTVYSGPTSGTGPSISELDLVITPRKQGNMIALDWMVNGEIHHNAVFVVTRNGTLLGEAVGVSNNRWEGVTSAIFDENNSSTPDAFIVRILDMDSLDVESTYRVHVRSSTTTAYNFHLNHTIGADNQNAHEAMLSVGTATEIWQE